MLELAIIGSIMLLVIGFVIQRGMEYNYALNLRMQTFRDALNRAYNADPENEDIGVNLAVIKDKPLITNQSPFGFSNRYPFQAASQVLWTNDLRIGYDSNDYTDPQRLPYFLPKITLRINNESYLFTTAGYKEVACRDDFKKKEEDYRDEFLINGSPGSDGIYWYWKTVGCNVEAREDVDVDGDDQVELILEKTPEGILRVIDSQEGELDLTFNATRQSLRNEIPEGGLNEIVSPRRTWQFTKLSLSLTKTEDPNQITNISRINSSETFYRFILLNKVTYYPGYENIQQQINSKNQGYDCNGADEFKCHWIYDGDKYAQKVSGGEYKWLAAPALHQKNEVVQWQTAH